MTDSTDMGQRVAEPPLPARPIARLLQKLEAAAKVQGRARTSHEQQQAESHIWTVRLELRAELAKLQERVEVAETNCEHWHEQADRDYAARVEAEAAIDAALGTTWTPDDPALPAGGWGDEDDTLYPDRLAALAALQPYWQRWGDEAWGRLGLAESKLTDLKQSRVES